MTDIQTFRVRRGRPIFRVPDDGRLFRDRRVFQQFLDVGNPILAFHRQMSAQYRRFLATGTRRIRRTPRVFAARCSQTAVPPLAPAADGQGAVEHPVDNNWTRRNSNAMR